MEISVPDGKKDFRGTKFFFVEKKNNKFFLKHYPQSSKS